MKIRVSNFQHHCVYDGPGVRTTVFLHGCPHQCPWCCNPETSNGRILMLNKEKCLRVQNIHSELCNKCTYPIVTGLSPNICPFHALSYNYEEFTTEEVVNECLKDIDIFKESNGGVTFSGGEPMIQANNLIPILRILRNQEIDVAIETTLTVDSDKLNYVIPFINEFIIDLKLQPSMYLYNLNYLKTIRNNIKILQGKARLRFRLVYIPGMIKTADKIVQTLKSCGISSIELLKCHNLGAKKYDRLGRNYHMIKIPAGEYESFADLLSEHFNLTKLTI